jgi:NAD-dependent SIR2 family protein deacetylase
MYLRRKIMTSTQDYSARINSAAGALAESDHILIGAGAGLSAAAGLNYKDLRLFQDWYPQFAALGYRNIWDAIVHHWSPDEGNRKQFWAFWATHIQRIRYDAGPSKLYLDLHRLVRDKSHFVITINVDGQFKKARFDPHRMFTPQGDYGKFQCAKPCRNILHDNLEMVQRMLANLDNSRLRVREEDIPRCPTCGGYLERNLRRDDHFVEEPYMEKQCDYADFINRSTGGKLVLLELGVGFNTPSIIRWPFERITTQHPHAALIRINLDDVRVPGEIAAKSIAFQQDIAQVIQALVDRDHDSGTCLAGRNRPS